MAVLVFPGSNRERVALLAAVDRHCSCQREDATVRSVCPAHTLLLDEATIRRLIFYRRWQSALWRGELLGDPGWAQATA